MSRKQEVLVEIKKGLIDKCHGSRFFRYGCLWDANFMANFKNRVNKENNVAVGRFIRYWCLISVHVAVLLEFLLEFKYEVDIWVHAVFHDMGIYEAKFLFKFQNEVDIADNVAVGEFLFSVSMVDLP